MPNPLLEDFGAMDATRRTAMATTEADFRTRLQDWLPKLVLAPSLRGRSCCSSTASSSSRSTCPSPDQQDAAARSTWSASSNYAEAVRRCRHWYIAIGNLAIFASALHRDLHGARPVLAILLDQKIRGEGVLAADLSLSDGAVVHRHRHGLEMVPRPGHRA